MGTHSASSTPAPTLDQIIQSTFTAADAAANLFSLFGGLAGTAKAVQGGTVVSACHKAMDDAEKLATTAFNTQFGSDTPLNGQVDKGFCPNWSTDPNFDNAANQMAQDFTNWAVDLDTDQVNTLLMTINNEVAAGGGAAGTSFGTVSVSANQYVNWTVAYGTVAQDNEGDQTLIYAFAAAQGGGL